MKSQLDPPSDLPSADRQVRDQLGPVGWVALGRVLERNRSGPGVRMPSVHGARRARRSPRR